MNTQSRTEGNRQRLRLKSLFKKSLVPRVIRDKWESVKTVICSQLHKHPKSSGTGYRRHHRKTYRYILEEVVKPGYEPIWFERDFNKPKLIGSVFVYEKRLFKIVKTPSYRGRRKKFLGFF